MYVSCSNRRTTMLLSLSHPSRVSLTFGCVCVCVCVYSLVGECFGSLLSLSLSLSTRQHCEVEFCKQHDFLPFKCDKCERTHCGAHRTYAAHQCAKFSHTTRDVQLIPCPACQKPLALSQSQLSDPDAVVNLHLNTECSKTGHRRVRCP
jgi:AN1-like Zinc finger